MQGSEVGFMHYFVHGDSGVLNEAFNQSLRLFMSDQGTASRLENTSERATGLSPDIAASCPRNGVVKEWTFLWRWRIQRLIQAGRVMFSEVE